MESWIRRWIRGVVTGRRGVAGGDAERKSIGARGERAAARHLRAQGMRVIARNVVAGAGEMDLVCVDRDGVVVVVEVKSRVVRAGERGPAPEASITADKQRKLLALARGAAQKMGVDTRRVRIDVVGVEFLEDGAVEIRHHRRAVTARR